MSIAEQVQNAVQGLPPEEQQQVLEFAAALRSRHDVAAVRADPASIWKKLADLGRAGAAQPSQLPNDLAANHDHYLHGLPKRR